MAAAVERDRSYRVLVAEDDDAFAEALKLALATEPGIEVIAHARNGAEAVALAARLVPDLVVMDVEMPVLDGIEATRRIRAGDSARHVVVLTGSDVDVHGNAAWEAGAVAFLPKRTGADELLRVVRELRSDTRAAR